MSLIYLGGTEGGGSYLALGIFNGTGARENGMATDRLVDRSCPLELTNVIYGGGGVVTNGARGVSRASGASGWHLIRTKIW